MKRLNAIVFGVLSCLAASLAVPVPAVAATLSIEGEVYARKSAVLIPPNVRYLWTLTITKLAADGAPVNKGDVVLAFDGSQLTQRLTSKRNSIAEQRSELEKLRMEIEQRTRNARLRTAEARAELEKARRKTAQPQALIPGIEYRKLMIARDKAQRRMVLMKKRERLAAEQRRQELRLLEAEIAELTEEAADLQAGLAALQIVAPRSGVLMHKTSLGGEKFEVGTRIFRGQTVAEIPDPSSLAVRAALPERDFSRVDVGMPVRVVVEGGARVAVPGQVRAIGQTVHSKSRVQPVPVLDLEIALDESVLAEGTGGLKPGQVVRVEIRVVDAEPQT